MIHVNVAIIVLHLSSDISHFLKRCSDQRHHSLILLLLSFTTGYSPLSVVLLLSLHCVTYLQVFRRSDFGVLVRVLVEALL